MAKKISCIVLSFLIVLLSVPSIRSRADGVSIFRAITSDIFEDQYGSEALSWVSPQFSRSESYFDDFSSTDFDFLNDPTNYPFDITSDRVIYSFGGFNAAKGNMQIVALDFSEISGDLYSVFTNVNGITVASNNTAEQVPSATGYYLNYSPYSHSFIQSTTFELSGTRALNAHIVPTFVQNDPNPDPNGKQKASVESLNELYTFYNYSSGYLSYMFYTNCQHYYSSNQFWDSYVATDATVGSQISNNFGALNLFDSLCTDYLDGGFSSYFDGNGIVTPERPDDVVIEDNTNHLFLRNVNSGFCKPANMNNLSSVGGGYLYVSYDFDDWIQYHNSSYDFQLTSDFNIDGTHYGGIIRQPLDLQGVSIYPFNDLGSLVNWSGENLVFFQSNEQLLSNYYKGYVYSMPYSKFILNRDKIVEGSNGSGATNLIFLTSFLAESVSGYNITNLSGTNLENLFVSQVEHNIFTLTITCKLIDKISGEESGTFVKTFNLLNGVTNTSDKSIEDNRNPFENSVDDVNYPIDNIGGGYNNYPYYGSNNNINNINIPSNYTVTYRDGVNSFIDFYNKDPSTTGIMNSFWGLMGVFRGNPATDIYEDYWGFLPSSFKNIVLACASLGIIGFAATVLRKRLMR